LTAHPCVSGPQSAGKRAWALRNPGNLTSFLLPSQAGEPQIIGIRTDFTLFRERLAKACRVSDMKAAELSLSTGLSPRRPVEEFVKTSGVSILTPHMRVGMRLRCTRCGGGDCFC
jgi:hypothetical protein